MPERVEKKLKKTGNFLPKSPDEEENYQLRGDTGIFWCAWARKESVLTTNYKSTKSNTNCIAIHVMGRGSECVRRAPWGTR